MVTLFVQLVVLSSLLLGPVPDTRTQAERDAAARWAVEHRQDVFDAVIPSAMSADVRMPICRVTTLRASGTIDRFEYGLRLVEPCPVISDRGVITKAAPTGEFLVADGTPITDQLARLRLQTPALTPESAVARIRVRRIELTAGEAKRLLAHLSESLVSLLPPTDISLDAPTYELQSTTGITHRHVELTPAGTGPGERRIMKLAARVAASQGFDEKRLRYDASFWE